MSEFTSEAAEQSVVSIETLALTDSAGALVNVLVLMRSPNAPIDAAVQQLLPGPTLIAAAAAGSVPQITPQATALASGAAPTVAISGPNATPTIVFGIPAGPPGPLPAISAAAAPLAAGSTPTVAVSGSAATPTLTFGIPAGATGPTPAISATATPLPPGAAPTVAVSGPATAPVLSLGIPTGQTGAPGEPGATGPAVVQGLLTMLGAWNASTNTPALASSVGVANTGYFVTTAGTTALNGVTSWAVNDVVAFVGGAWIKLPGYAAAAAVASLGIGSATFSNTGSMDPLYSLADPNGFTVYEIGGSGQVRPQSIQFGENASAIPILSSTGVQLGSIGSDGSIEMAGLGSFGNGTMVVASGANSDVRFVDQSGFVGLILSSTGLTVANLNAQAVTSALALPAGSSLGGITASASTEYDFAIGDPAGYLIYSQTNGVALDAAASAGAGGGSSTTSYSADEIAERNNRALAFSTQAARQVDTTSARPIWNYNHIFIYGQSLSDGWEGWPALSVTPKYDSLMLGESVRPISESGTTWVPLGSSTFSPLVEVNQSNGTSSALLSNAAVAALAPGDFTLGETVASGAVNFLRKQQLQMRALAADPSRLLVASSCGVGGQTIAQLSKGATPELFNRLRTCATAVKAAATAAGGTYGVAAVIYIQGENDYINTPETTLATYLAELEQLYTDFNNDITTTISGQKAPPAFFIYQTGEAYARDDIAIGQAQLNLALAQNGWYMVGPDYPVTDKGGHLDPNGYRWLGAQFGKVMHRVIDRGERWLPLYPTRATYRGLYVLIDFHVPEPPLVFDTPWTGEEATYLEKATLTNQGFTIQDDAGLVSIVAVSLAGDAVVQIELGRALTTNPILKIADFTHNDGNAGLRDSDPTVADDVYSYTAGNGQYAVANIPSLIGQPYPLYNWVVACSIPIVAG